MPASPDENNPVPGRCDLVWQASQVPRSAREKQNGHKGRVVWLTGLSGSGKSTIAHALEAKLHASGCQTVVLDGDNIRHGLSTDLGFSIADRNENTRRVGEVAKLFLMQGIIVIVALISPLRKARAGVMALFHEGDFIEVYCKCSLETCMERDPKGLYDKAARGMISELTGVSSPYEAPCDPALTLDTEHASMTHCTDRLEHFLRDRL